MLRGRRGTVVWAVLLALTAGCGSSGASSLSGASGPSAPVSAVTQIDQADQARAEAALLTQDDFPAAFYPGEKPKDGRLCVDEKGITFHGNEISNNFTRDDASYLMFVRNRVVVTQDEDAAKTFYENATSQPAFDCIADELTKGSPG